MKRLRVNLRNRKQFDFGSFIQNRYRLFIKRFTEENKETFEQLNFWLSFIITDPSKLPMDAEDFTESGMSELDNLSEWYWEAKIECMNQEVSRQSADLSVRAGFLSVMSERKKLYLHKID